ncbi:MAG: GNAT family N-acetyltransferase [Solobacterium sp.]|nr:GNAT family N-acetyltransferase [Solobacterium sp.]
MGIRLQDIVDALERTDREHSFFYDVRNDRLIREDETSAGSEECIPLPDYRRIDDYGIMEDYIAQVKDSEAREWLGNAIKGKGAFRMFRAVCDRFGLTGDWYAFREREYEDLAADWCVENGLAYEDEVRQEEPDDFYDYEEEEDEPEPVQVRKTMKYSTVTRKNMLGVTLLVRDYLKETGRNRDADVMDGQNMLEEALKDECVVYQAAENGLPAGFAVGRDDCLVDLYVRPEYRRRGIGTALVKQLEVQGVHAADLRPDNPAGEGFLQANGYVNVEYIRLGKGERS